MDNPSPAYLRGGGLAGMGHTVTVACTWQDRDTEPIVEFAFGEKRQ